MIRLFSIQGKPTVPANLMIALMVLCGIATKPGMSLAVDQPTVDQPTVGTTTPMLPDITSAQLVQAVTQQDQMYTTLRVSFTTKVIRKMVQVMRLPGGRQFHSPKKQRLKIDFHADAGKYHYQLQHERRDKIDPVHLVLTYDGVTRYEWSPISNEGQTFRSTPEVAWPDPREFGCSLGRQYRSQLIGTSLAKSRITVIASQITDGHPCYRVEALLPDGAKAHVWIDPNAGWRARRVAVWDADGTPSHETSVTLSEVTPGAWFASTGEQRLIATHADDPQDSRPDSRWKFWLHDIDLDIQPTLQQFTVEFPKGTTVFDHHKRFGYIAGEWESRYQPRDLQFNSDRSIGVVYVQSWHAQSGGGQWTSLGQAKGKLKIQANKRVRLEIQTDDPASLAILANIEPNAIQQIKIWPMPATDEAMDHIANLAGAEILDLSQTDLTDVGAKHLSRMRGLRELHLTATAITDNALLALASMPTLNKLFLNETSITDHGLAHLSRVLSLNTLDLSSTLVTNIGLVDLSDLTGLTALYLTATNITDPSPNTLFLSALPNLEYLSLNKTRIGNATAAHMVTLKRLQDLELLDTAISNDGLRQLGNLTSLQSLKLSADHFMGDALQHLEQLTSLQHLTVRSYQNVNDQGLPSLVQLRRLSSLELSGRGITDIVMVHASSIPTLTSLSLSDCGVSDTGMAMLFRLINLQRLTLNHTEVSNLGLRQLRYLPKLVILDITTDQPTITNIQHLQALGQLKQLRIAINNLDDKQIAHLSSMVNLEHLEWNVAGLSDDATKHLTKLTNLTDLTILGPTTLSDAGLAHLSRLTNLRRLHIAGQFTDTGIKHLSSLRSLEQLDLATASVQAKALKTLRRSLPSLQYRILP